MRRLLLIFLSISFCCAGGFNGVKPGLGSQIDWSHPLSKGLVGCWLFNEGSGYTLFDVSGSTQGGVVSGNPVWTPASQGPGLDCDNSGDHIDITMPGITKEDGVTFVLAGAFTYASGDFLIDAQDSTDNRLLLVNHHNNMFQTDREWGGGYQRLNYAILDGKPHQMVFVIPTTADPVVYYLDGIVQSATGVPSGYGESGNANELRINGRLASTSYSSDSTIDYLYLYHRELSASEVASLYVDPFQMFERDITPLYVTAGAPAAGAPQVITVIMSSIPWLLPLSVLTGMVGACAHSRRAA